MDDLINQLEESLSGINADEDTITQSDIASRRYTKAKTFEANTVAADADELFRYMMEQDIEDPNAAFRSINGIPDMAPATSHQELMRNMDDNFSPYGEDKTLEDLVREELEKRRR